MVYRPSEPNQPNPRKGEILTAAAFSAGVVLLANIASAVIGPSSADHKPVVGFACERFTQTDQDHALAIMRVSSLGSTAISTSIASAVAADQIRQNACGLSDAGTYAVDPIDCIPAANSSPDGKTYIFDCTTQTLVDTEHTHGG